MFTYLWRCAQAAAIDMICHIGFFGPALHPGFVCHSLSGRGFLNRTSKAGGHATGKRSRRCKRRERQKGKDKKTEADEMDDE